MPDNFLFDANFNPYLSDFGFAIKHEFTIKTKCTLHYASPELLAQNGPYRPKLADIWSLGVTFFAIATKSFPYDCNKVVSEEILSYIDNTIEITKSLTFSKTHNPIFSDKTSIIIIISCIVKIIISAIFIIILIIKCHESKNREFLNILDNSSIQNSEDLSFGL